MELDFKLECLQTKESVFLTEIELQRIMRMSARENKEIYRKLRPFYKYQENGNRDSNTDNIPKKS